MIIPLTTEAWYLHTDRTGSLLFKDVKNVVAQLNDYSANYNEETVKKDLVNYIKDLFIPGLKDCYQTLYVLPSLDEIEVTQDKVALVIYSPHFSGGMHPDLQKFYDDQTYKNRIMFLSGDNKTLATVNENAGQWKAINQILADLKTQNVATNSTEYVDAERLKESIQFNLRSALQQTFVKLWYPHSTGLKTDNFTMKFNDNTYNGEEQIRTVLKDAYKFTEDVTDDTFRLQCETKLFTQKKMPWNEVKKTAAMNVKWLWHKPDALDQLKNDMIFKGQWRSDGSNWLEKGPFPAPSTEVRFQRINRNEDTGEVTLKITPVNGDVVHYEIGGTATTASAKVEDFKEFKTSDLLVSFLCVDTTGKHETGTAETWKNEITLTYRLFDQAGKKMLELKASPQANIKYTTDGSSPSPNGSTYNAPFPLLSETTKIVAEAEKSGITSNQLNIDVPKGASKPVIVINKDTPLKWKRKQAFTTTQETYDFFEKAKKYEANVYLSSVTIQGAEKWVELSMDNMLEVSPEKLEEVISNVRENIFGEGEVSSEVVAMQFSTGQKFEDYLHELKTELKPNEIEQ